MLESDCGVFASYCCDYFAPECGRGEDVGFVDAGQVSLTRGGALERIAGYSFDFCRAVVGDIAGARMAVVAMEFVGAEVDIAREFADDFEIAAGDALRAEGRNSLESVAQADGAKVNVQAEFFSQGEQAAFGTVREWERVPLRAADGAEQNRIGF